MAECNTEVLEMVVPKVITNAEEYRGVSTDEKPSGVPLYSIYFEMDTNTFYYYDGTQWVEIPCGN